MSAPAAHPKMAGFVRPEVILRWYVVGTSRRSLSKLDSSSGDADLIAQGGGYAFSKCRPEKKGLRPAAWSQTDVEPFASRLTLPR